jgi:vanillin dehydrogenase
MLNKAADMLRARAAEFTELMMGETGAAAPWVQFNVKLAAGMLREAASMTTLITGEVMPSDVPGCAGSVRRNESERIWASRQLSWNS